jgi:hypothetical protein
MFKGAISRLKRASAPSSPTAATRPSSAIARLLAAQFSGKPVADQ